MPDDGRNLPAVAAVGAIHLLDHLAVPLHEPGIQRKLLAKAGQVLRRDAHVQIVGARRKNIGACRRRLGRHHRVDVGIEEHRVQPGEQLIQRLTVRRREPRARPGRGVRCGLERFRGAGQHELTRALVVVRTAVDPEQFGVPEDLRVRLGLDSRRGDDRLEHVAHLETPRVLLIVEDVAAGKRRLIEMPDERFLGERQIAESVRVHLHDGRVANALEEIRPPGRCRRGIGRRCGGIRRPATARGGSEYGHHSEGPLEHSWFSEQLTAPLTASFTVNGSQLRAEQSLN